MAPAPAAVTGLDPNSVSSSVTSALDEPKTTAGLGAAVANVLPAQAGGNNGGGIGGFLTSELGSILGDGGGQTSTSAKATTTSASRTTTSAKASTTSTTSSSTSRTTSTTSSTTSSPSTTSTTTTTSSSMNTARVLNTQSTSSLILTFPTTSSSVPTTSPTALDNANTGSATTSGLSQPAMIGIIAGAGAVAIFIILFVLRKLCLARRRRERVQWEAGLATYNAPKQAGSNEKVEAEVARRLNANVVAPLAPLPPSMPRQPQPPRSPTSNVTKRPTADMVRPYQVRAPMPPPSTMAMVGAYPVFSASSSPPQKRISADSNIPPSSSRYAVAPPPPSLSPAQGVFKNVLTTYSPQLPDELPLTIGERVRVIEVYEDGWAMVERVGPGPAGGMMEKGVVPAECLGISPR
ncbi:hypothetical protein CALVIDRAFT_559699 [Calocera viscosa TUFC12733]|uniref:SH3 domain-containing protein n=1 Tax=Calocera viscosa (strain TUFC12733) TaxID=1330018 RepID=A0A167RLE3_CALVF|nr:hypothetical protein CALVIDRAFT_559699 [Calocera viscosa TUFC12733]